MKKRTKFSIIFILLLTFVCTFSFNYKFVSADEKIYLGGFTAGFSIQTKGVNVVGLCDVITSDGIRSPAKDADLKVGDTILEIDNQQVNSALDVEKNISNKKYIEVKFKRCKEMFNATINLAKDLNGKEKLGVFIKNDISGIGTVTYVKGNRFASLGHPVLNNDGSVVEIIGGEIFNCSITGCKKGERGCAGELRGVFLKDKAIANIEKNNAYGVYGKLSDNFDCSSLKEVSIGDATIGDAHIYSTIDGSTPKKYSISIIKVDSINQDKNFVIRINDKELLEKTNGIVQGMSGSPIIQNGKLVGAVTHVFINDPTRGFGLSIQNMINN